MRKPGPRTFSNTFVTIFSGETTSAAETKPGDCISLVKLRERACAHRLLARVSNSRYDADGSNPRLKLATASSSAIGSIGFGK